MHPAGTGGSSSRPDAADPEDRPSGWTEGTRQGRQVAGGEPPSGGPRGPCQPPGGFRHRCSEKERRTPRSPGGGSGRRGPRAAEAGKASSRSGRLSRRRRKARSAPGVPPEASSRQPGQRATPATRAANALRSTRRLRPPRQATPATHATQGTARYARATQARPKGCETPQRQRNAPPSNDAPCDAIGTANAPPRQRTHRTAPTLRHPRSAQGSADSASAWRRSRASARGTSPRTGPPASAEGRGRKKEARLRPGLRGGPGNADSGRRSSRRTT